jgi:hypothetical protein
MTRQVTDQLYIDLEYFTPEEYYTYIAEAQSAQAAAFTQTTAVGKLVSATADLASEFTQTAQGFRTVEIVLSAFSDAALSSTANVTRSTAVSVSSEFNLEASASGFENAEAALTSTATMSCAVTKIVSGLADISAEFTQITVAERQINVSAAFESSVTMDTVATRTVTFGVGLSSDADCSCVNFRVRELSISAGALFNTATSASATINSFAVLDSVSTLSAIVDRQVGTSTATLTSEFTQTVQGQRVRFVDSDIASASELTATALSFTRASAALSSTASLTSTLSLRLRPAGYIFWADDYGTVLDSVNDSGRLRLTQRNINNFAQVASDDTKGYANQLFASSNFTVEFLLRTESSPGISGMNATTTNADYYRGIVNFESGKLWIALRYASATTAILQFGVRNDAGTSFTLATSAFSSLPAFSHIAFVKSGTTIYAFLNGTRVNSATVSGVFTLDANQNFRLGSGSIASVNRNNLICDLDELRLSIVARYANNATITVPTTPFANDKTAIGLFHMEEYLTPAPVQDFATAGDNGLTLVSAALSSAFTQTAAVDRLRTISGSADLSSQFALSAVIGSIEEISSSMFDDVELSATASVTRTTAISLSSEFTQTATSTRIQHAASDQSSEFTQVTDVERTRTAASALASEFTQVTDISIAKIAEAQLSSECSVSSTVSITRNIDASLTAEFALDTANQRVRYAESAQSSEFTQTTDVQRVQQAASDLNSEFTQVTNIERFRATAVDLASESTQVTDIDRIRYGLGDLNSEFTQVADSIRIQQGHADISAAFEQTTTAARTRNLESAQSTQADITINAVKTVNVAVTTEAIATQLTAAAKIGDFLIDCAVTASVSCSGSRVRFFENLSEPRGVNLQDDVTGTDLGPFLLLDNVPTTSVVTRSLISFWTNEGTVGAVLNTDGIYDGNPSGTNILTIAKEGSDYFLYYYGNRAEAGVFPYVKWVIDYRREDLLHNFLIYIDTGGFPTQTTTESYRFFLDGVEQTQLAVTDAYTEPKKSHPFTIKDELLLGYGSRFFAIGNGSGYTPYGNLENTSPDSAVLAQFWFDNNTEYDLDDSDLRNKFYNAGWTDLGVDGTATGLSRPDYYVRLNGYQDLDEQGTVSAAGNNWSWRYFNNQRVISGVPLYDVSGFAATPDQDNPYVTQIVARLNAGITVAALFAANLQSTSTLSATVERIQANSADLSSEFTQTANITVNIGTITELQSQTALSINAGYLLEATSTQNSLFTVQATVGAIGDNSVDMVSAFAVSADVDSIPPIRIEADLAGQFALQAITGFEQQAQADLSSAFALSADVDSIPPLRIEANLSSEFAVTASLQGSFDNQASLDSQFTQTTSGGRIRRPSAGLSAQATLIANNNTVVGFSANLPAVATQLTVGSLIHIDPFYQYKVESETRRGTVLPENRVFQVESETRVNMIL